MSTIFNSTDSESQVLVMPERRRMTFTRSLIINLRSKPLGTIGLAIVLFIGIVALFSPWIARYPYEEPGPLQSQETRARIAKGRAETHWARPGSGSASFHKVQQPRNKLSAVALSRLTTNPLP